MRITPACAGITCPCAIGRVAVQDHPRVCGNYIKSAIAIALEGGSPPRVRELLQYALRIGELTRITPACAGITSTFFNLPPFRQDHPRVCGNYAVQPAALSLGRGSPPRVRELLAYL